jgi:hypothetical protein
VSGGDEIERDAMMGERKGGGRIVPKRIDWGRKREGGWSWR